MHIWELLVKIHCGDWTTLVVFYSVVVGIILFVLLQLLLVRSRKASLKALAAVRDLLEDMKAMESQLDKLESRIEQGFNEWQAELETRMTRKIDQKGDLIQERVEQRSGTLSDSINQLDSRVGRSDDQMQQFRERVAEVENRIPNLFDRLDEFRGALAKTFQVELGSVLSSFDNSMGAILQQMKSDLQLGISRIEGIESMVRTREKAGRTLLGAGEEPALPGPADEEEEEFGEWERQAKELAESEESEEEEPDELIEAVPLSPAAPEEPYPAEMGETAGQEPEAPESDWDDEGEET